MNVFERLWLSESDRRLQLEWRETHERVLLSDALVGRARASQGKRSGRRHRQTSSSSVVVPSKTPAVEQVKHPTTLLLADIDEVKRLRMKQALDESEAIRQSTVKCRHVAKQNRDMELRKAEVHQLAISKQRADACVEAVQQVLRRFRPLLTAELSKLDQMRRDEMSERIPPSDTPSETTGSTSPSPFPLMSPTTPGRSSPWPTASTSPRRSPNSIASTTAPDGVQHNHVIKPSAAGLRLAPLVPPQGIHTRAEAHRAAAVKSTGASLPALPPRAAVDELIQRIELRAADDEALAMKLSHKAVLDVKRDIALVARRRHDAELEMRKLRDEQRLQRTIMERHLQLESSRKREVLSGVSAAGNVAPVVGVGGVAAPVADKRLNLWRRLPLCMQQAVSSMDIFSLKDLDKAIHVSLESSLRDLQLRRRQLLESTLQSLWEQNRQAEGALRDTTAAVQQALSDATTQHQGGRANNSTKLPPSSSAATDTAMRWLKRAGSIVGGSASFVTAMVSAAVAPTAHHPPVAASHDALLQAARQKIIAKELQAFQRFRQSSAIAHQQKETLKAKGAGGDSPLDLPNPYWINGLQRVVQQFRHQHPQPSQPSQDDGGNGSEPKSATLTLEILPDAAIAENSDSFRIGVVDVQLLFDVIAAFPVAVIRITVPGLYFDPPASLAFLELCLEVSSSQAAGCGGDVLRRIEAPHSAPPSSPSATLVTAAHHANDVMNDSDRVTALFRPPEVWDLVTRLLRGHREAQLYRKGAAIAQQKLKALVHAEAAEHQNIPRLRYLASSSCAMLASHFELWESCLRAILHMVNSEHRRLLAHVQQHSAKDAAASSEWRVACHSAQQLVMQQEYDEREAIEALMERHGTLVMREFVNIKQTFRRLSRRFSTATLAALQLQRRQSVSGLVSPSPDSIASPPRNSIAAVTAAFQQHARQSLSSGNIDTNGGGATHNSRRTKVVLDEGGDFGSHADLRHSQGQHGSSNRVSTLPAITMAMSMMVDHQREDDDERRRGEALDDAGEEDDDLSGGGGNDDMDVLMAAPPPLQQQHIVEDGEAGAGNGASTPPLLPTASGGAIRAAAPTSELEALDSQLRPIHSSASEVRPRSKGSHSFQSPPPSRQRLER